VSKELKTSSSLSFFDSLAKIEATSADLPGSGSVDVTGNNAITATKLVTPTDDTLDKGAVGDIGFFMLKNVATAGVPVAPAFTISVVGTTGSTHRRYVLVANFADGSKSVSACVGVTNTNTTQDGTHYQHFAWADVGAATYDLYRGIGDCPGSTIQVLTGITGTSCDDQGATNNNGDASALPAGISSRKGVLIGYDGSDYPDLLYAGETALRRANPLEMSDIHVKSAFGQDVEIEYTIIEN
jgi:hypothetical protein